MGALTVGELQVILSGDTRKLNRDLDKIDNRAAATERQHSAAWSRIGDTAGRAITAGMVLAGGAVAGLGVAISKGLNMANFTEQAEISFGTLLGSAEAAKTYMVDLQQFAAKTPFELPGVVDAARQLIGVGASAESVIPTLSAWGNASGALGQTQEQFGRTMTAVTQMMGKGKVSAEEMMQVTEAGIPIWALMAKATGKPIGELQKLASEGKLMASDVLPALESQMQADYGGSMAKQAMTLSGVWSTTKDNLNLALKDGVQPLAAGLKVALPDASAAAADAIRELGLRGSEGLLNLIERGQELREEFGPEMAALGGAAADKWEQFTDVLDELGEQVGPSLPGIADGLVRIVTAGSEVGTEVLGILKSGLVVVGPLADAFAGTLNLVADALEVIEPILPGVAIGLLAFKGIDVANRALDALGGRGGILSGLVQNLDGAAIKAGVFTERITGSANAGERVMTSMGKVGSAVSRVGAALPAVGLAVGVVGMAMERGEQQAKEWGQALLDGGVAAEQAMLGAAKEGVIEAMTRNMGALGGVVGLWATNSEEAKTAADELYAAMSPLQQAQQDVTTATNELLEAQEDHGAGSDQAAGKARVLASEQRALEIIQRNLENATRGATGALMDQAQQAIANANAELGFQSSLMGTQQAITDYTTGLQDGTITADQRAQSENQLAQQITNTVMAAGAAAAETHKNSSEAERNAAVISAQRDAFNQLTGQLGYVPAALQQVGTDLNKAGVAAGSTAEQMRGLGLSVLDIPGNKTVFIEAPTAEQEKRLKDLGLTVRTLPNGRIYVTADTSPAEGTLAAFMNQRRTIQLEAIVASGGPRTALGGLGGGGGLQERAAGGPISAGTPYLVGEEGPELIYPSHAAFVATAQQTAAFLAAAGNGRAAAMLPPSISGSAARGAGGAGSSAFGAAGQVAEVHHHKHYELKATVDKTTTLPEFIRLQEEAEALYG